MAQLSIVAQRDCSIEAIANPDTNLGSATRIYVEVYYTGGEKSYWFRLLLNFDVTPLIGSYASIDAAKVTLLCDGLFAEADAWVRRNTRPSTWTQSGATWNKYDGVNNWAAGGGDSDDTPTPVGFTISSPGLLEITGLLAFVTDAIANRDNIVALHLRLQAEAPAASAGGEFYSKEYPTADQYKPNLVIDYTPLVVPPYIKPVKLLQP